MIPCTNCKSLNKEGSTVCEFCGAALVTNNYNNQNVNINSAPNNINSYNQPVQQNVQNNFNQPVQQNVPNNLNQVNSGNQTMQNDVNRMEYNTKDMVSSYIGKNYYKIINHGFSWCSLFLGGFYFWYRKMYKLLLIWLIISFAIGIASYFIKIPYLPIIASLIALIILAANFKSSYIGHAHKVVDKVIDNNYGKSQEELNRICAKKGGTTIIPIILLLLLSVVPLITFGPLLISFIASISFTKDVDQARALIYVEKGESAISSIKQELVVNSIEGDDICSNEACVYNLEQINAVSELRLALSPFGNQITNACVWAKKNGTNVYGEGSYTFEVCMVDSKGIGFNKTSERSLSKSDVKASGINCSC